MHALQLHPYHGKALHRLALAEEALQRPKAAATALCLGAAHNPSLYEHFAKAARKLGAWKLPPPLVDDPDHPLGEKPSDRLVKRIVAPTRREFMKYVVAGEPVIVRDFSPDARGWNLDELARLADAEEATDIVGDVIVSATGCVPDYQRPDARGSDTKPRASRVEAMRTRGMALPEVIQRVFGCGAQRRPTTRETGSCPIPAKTQDNAPSDASDSAPLTLEENGERAPEQSAADEPPPPEWRGDEWHVEWRGDEWHVRHEKIYAYGDNWMLKLPWLREQARRARPSFFELRDLTFGQPLADGDDLEVKNCVGWVSSRGALTPMHHDMTDGVLAQMVGQKRVWLYDWKVHEHCYLRGRGDDGWERQSAADLHGTAAGAAFPALANQQRWRADLSPGELLYIPSNWLHEVHARTPSFSLGWRFAMVRDDGVPLIGVSEQRCPNKMPPKSAEQLLEDRCRRKMGEMRRDVDSGKRTEADTLDEAMHDPELREWLRGRGMPIPAQYHRVQ